MDSLLPDFLKSKVATPSLRPPWLGTDSIGSSQILHRLFSAQEWTQNLAVCPKKRGTLQTLYGDTIGKMEEGLSVRSINPDIQFVGKF